jgi:hypothetical protein
LVPTYRPHAQERKAWLASGTWNDQESSPVAPDHKPGILATTDRRLVNYYYYYYYYY